MTQPNEKHTSEISPQAREILDAMELPFVKYGDYEKYNYFSERRPNPVVETEYADRGKFVEQQDAALEAFVAQQSRELTSFERNQKTSRLGLTQDASNQDIDAREQTIALAQKVYKMKASLMRFIQALRLGKAGDYGYIMIAESLFEKRPNTCLAQDIDGGLPDEIKDRVIEEVLAQTGLSKDEADRLVLKQRESNEVEHLKGSTRKDIKL